MSVPALVSGFYERIWNSGNLEAADELLSENFRFRGSLGAELAGIEPFKAYVRAVRSALANYRCEIIDCVSEGTRAFARMQFHGLHVGVFEGYPPSGKLVTWAGAALFGFEGLVIADLWVLGDLAGLTATLDRNRTSPTFVGAHGDV